MGRLILPGGNMAAKQDNDTDMDDDADILDGSDDIEQFLNAMEELDKEQINSMTARRRIEELLEERKLREQIQDYTDWDDL